MNYASDAETYGTNSFRERRLFVAWPEINILGNLVNRTLMLWRFNKDWDFDHQYLDDERQLTKLIEIEPVDYFSQCPLPDGSLLLDGIPQIMIFNPDTLIVHEILKQADMSWVFVSWICALEDGRVGFLTKTLQGHNNPDILYQINLYHLNYLQGKWAKFLADEIQQAYNSTLDNDLVEKSIPPIIGDLVNQYYLAPVAFFNNSKPSEVKEDLQATAAPPPTIKLKNFEPIR